MFIRVLKLVVPTWTYQEAANGETAIQLAVGGGDPALRHNSYYGSTAFTLNHDDDAAAAAASSSSTEIGGATTPSSSSTKQHFDIIFMDQ
jgi:hypothetical protein